MPICSQSSSFFNVETHQWTPGPEFSEARVCPGMANILGKVYVMGGSNELTSSSGPSEGVVLNEDGTVWVPAPELGPIDTPDYMYIIPYNF